MASQATSRRRTRQGGQEIIEFTFLLVPVLGFLFLTIDIAWMVFTRATLQHAVREGARYAVVNGPAYLSNPTGETTVVKDRVKQFAFGLLTGKDDQILVTWYTQQPNATTGQYEYVIATGTGANNSGNLVEVSVEGYSAKSLLGVFHDLTPFVFAARSADRM
ncbi:MAG: TadE/TadG family type IV pilus assembly protein [Bryobacteraceae bacterium]|jgi:Flp pilus assembly protein TadG